MSSAFQPSREIELADSDLLVSINDSAGNYSYANEAFLKIRNWQWDDTKGTASREKSDGNPNQVMQDMILTMRRRQPWTGLYRNNLNNGDYFWSRVHMSPLSANRKYAGALVVHSKPLREEVEQIKRI